MENGKNIRTRIESGEVMRQMRVKGNDVLVGILRHRLSNEVPKMTSSYNVTTALWTVNFGTVSKEQWTALKDIILNHEFSSIEILEFTE